MRCWLTRFRRARVSAISSTAPAIAGAPAAVIALRPLELLAAVGPAMETVVMTYAAAVMRRRAVERGLKRALLSTTSAGVGLGASGSDDMAVL